MVVARAGPWCSMSILYLNAPSARESWTRRWSIRVCHDLCQIALVGAWRSLRPGRLAYTSSQQRARTTQRTHGRSHPPQAAGSPARSKLRVCARDARKLLQACCRCPERPFLVLYPYAGPPPTPDAVVSPVFRKHKPADHGLRSAALYHPPPRPLPFPLFPNRYIIPLPPTDLRICPPRFRSPSLYPATPVSSATTYLVLSSPPDQPQTPRSAGCNWATSSLTQESSDRILLQFSVQCSRTDPLYIVYSPSAIQPLSYPTWRRPLNTSASHNPPSGTSP